MARPGKQTASVWRGPGLLVALFLLLPLAEIGVFIQVGGLIGLWPTLGLIVATAIAGGIIVRAQGLSVLARARGALEANRMPVFELFEGACILVAGALLLTPGFVTDSFGALLLVPGTRRWLYQRFRRIAERHQAASAPADPTRPEPKVIDVDFEEVPADADPLREPGRGWGPRR
jgi:UPF0716 protein FxsA